MVARDGIEPPLAFSGLSVPVQINPSFLDERLLQRMQFAVRPESAKMI
jgi:hypothetical protein